MASSGNLGGTSAHSGNYTVRVAAAGSGTITNFKAANSGNA
jgi:hypothetical protein